MIPIPPSTIECIRKLLELVPELQPVYDEHISDNHELLPHVFMGDVTRYVVQRVCSGEEEEEQPVMRIIDHLEQCMATGDDQVKELVSVSFVENLLGNDNALAKLKDVMGPALAKEVETYYRGDRGEGQIQE
jgi:hypothetical protein